MKFVTTFINSMDELHALFCNNSKAQFAICAREVTGQVVGVDQSPSIVFLGQDKLLHAHQVALAYTEEHKQKLVTCQGSPLNYWMGGGGSTLKCTLLSFKNNAMVQGYRFLRIRDQ